MHRTDTASKYCSTHTTVCAKHTPSNIYTNDEIIVVKYFMYYLPLQVINITIVFKVIFAKLSTSLY